ncbi:MAG TPA: hypothetical protein VGK73_16375, partial [Polyangiaceae bacterium]
ALAGVIASPVVHTLVSAPAAQPAAPLRVLATDAPPAPRAQPESVGNRGTPVAVHALEPQPHAARDAQRVVPHVAASGSSDVVSGTDNALLAAEVELVERGRAALQRGAFQEALRTLAPYEERFPKQQLLTEVLFLRMESFNRSGDSARARALAARVVTRGITGPQAARAREVLER